MVEGGLARATNASAASRLFENMSRATTVNLTDAPPVAIVSPAPPDADLLAHATSAGVRRQGGCVDVGRQ
jgi:hypothetical protein